MASNDTATDDLKSRLKTLSIDRHSDLNSQTAYYYNNRDESKSIGFARLEKGLFLFLFVYETSKNSLANEIVLWDRRVCADLIKYGKCNKPDQCRYDHQSIYRQSNICLYWYQKDGCRFGAKCRDAHHLTNITNHHAIIRTETDANVYRLIRFVRNFAGHYIDSAISDPNEEQSLFKDVIVVMVHLVHYLSKKPNKSIDHLNLFLDKTTINQLNEENLLDELIKPYNIPRVFFDLRMNFNTNWYSRNAEKLTIDFNQLSPEFIRFFESAFTRYFQGRLKKRGALADWLTS